MKNRKEYNNNNNNNNNNNWFYYINISTSYWKNFFVGAGKENYWKILEATTIKRAEMKEKVENFLKHIHTNLLKGMNS